MKFTLYQNSFVFILLPQSFSRIPELGKISCGFNFVVVENIKFCVDLILLFNFVAFVKFYPRENLST